MQRVVGTLNGVNTHPCNAVGANKYEEISNPYQFIFQKVKFKFQDLQVKLFGNGELIKEGI